MTGSEAQGRVRLDIQGGVAILTFDRPEARNAMTWTMYEQLGAHCERLADDPAVRVAVLRGAGGEAFVAGTDIHQFLDFAGGADGVAYEARIDGHRADRAAAVSHHRRGRGLGRGRWLGHRHGL